MLSANRPYELLGTGANQTMEQLGYFGTQVREAISPDWRGGRAIWVRSTRSGGRRRRVLAAATGARTGNATGAVRHPTVGASGARSR